MNAAAGWAYIACALFVTFDVIARRYLGFSSRSTTELTGYLLAFGMSWGFAHALAERRHVRVDVLVNKLPAGLRQPLHVASLALLAVFAGYLTYGAVALVRESLDFGATDNSALRVPLALPQGLWAFGISMLFVLSVLLLIEALALLRGGRGAEAERRLSSFSFEEETTEALQAAGVEPARRA